VVSRSPSPGPLVTKPRAVGGRCQQPQTGDRLDAGEAPKLGLTPARHWRSDSGIGLRPLAVGLRPQLLPGTPAIHSASETLEQHGQQPIEPLDVTLWQR